MEGAEDFKRADRNNISYYKYNYRFQLSMQKINNLKKEIQDLVNQVIVKQIEENSSEHMRLMSVKMQLKSILKDNLYKD